MTPQAVVFDLGKVLLDFDYGIAARRVAARCSKPAVEVQACLDQSPLLFRLETGTIGTDEFFREVCAVTGYGGSVEEFGGFFGDIFSPIPPMVELNERLRAQGIPTYIFSNTNALAIRHVRASFPFFRNFSGYIFSYEHGAMKPDQRLYAALEQMTGLSGGALLYLDDRQENVLAGEARGWRCIHHQTPAESLAAVRRLGLLPE